MEYFCAFLRLLAATPLLDPFYSRHSRAAARIGFTSLTVAVHFESELLEPQPFQSVLRTPPKFTSAMLRRPIVVLLAASVSFLAVSAASLAEVQLVTQRQSEQAIKLTVS